MKKDISGFVVLLILFGIGIYAITTSTQESGPQTVQKELEPDPSIENNRGSGSKGLYDWTAELGYRPEAWRQSFDELPRDADVVFCIAPNYSPFDTGNTSVFTRPSDGQRDTNELTPDEGRAVNRWIKSGHTFILFASALPYSSDSETDTDRADSDEPTSTFAKLIGIDVEEALGPTDQRKDFVPTQPTGWTAGVSTISIHPGSRLRQPSPNGIVLFGDTFVKPSRPKAAGSSGSVPNEISQPVAMVYSVGRGHVIAVADNFFGCNNNLVRADNAQFIYRILVETTHPDAKILFDEYHRAIRHDESISVWSAISQPLRNGFLQLLFVGLIALFVVGPRFGRVVAVGGSETRTSGEYITSLANLYRNAGATKTALETVYRQFLREFCMRFGVPPTITLDQIAEIASRRGRIDGLQMRKALVTCEEALEGKSLSERDLVTLVRALERFRKELGIG